MLTPMLIQNEIKRDKGDDYVCLTLNVETEISNITKLKKMKFYILCDYTMQYRLKDVASNLIVDVDTFLIRDTRTNRTPPFIYPIALPYEIFDIGYFDSQKPLKSLKKDNLQLYIYWKRVFKNLHKFEDIDNLLN